MMSDCCVRLSQDCRTIMMVMMVVQLTSRPVPAHCSLFSPPTCSRLSDSGEVIRADWCVVQSVYTLQSSPSKAWAELEQGNRWCSPQSVQCSNTMLGLSNNNTSPHSSSSSVSVSFSPTDGREEMSTSRNTIQYRHLHNSSQLNNKIKPELYITLYFYVKKTIMIIL